MAEGWISLHRKIKESWIWQDKESFDRRSAWVDIILSVNHKEGKILVDNKLVVIKRGQFLTSEVKLSERWKWSRKSVRTFLKLLETDGMIQKIVQPNKFTIIEVLNYERYQNGTTQDTTQDTDNKGLEDNEGTTEGTTEEQQTDNTGTTEEQHENTNNNDNNNNNENNENKEINNMCDTPAEKPKKGGAQGDKPGKGDYTDDFEKFWSIYPRKKEKAKAFKVWCTRLKDKVDPADLIKAATNYSQYCKVTVTEERFIKHPSTFLGPDKPYEEYIDFEVKKEAPRNSNNTFANYGGQREYDAKELAKDLVGGSGTDVEELMKNADEKTRERLERVLGKSG